MKKFTEISIQACEKKMCHDLLCTTCGSVNLMSEFTIAVFPKSKRALNRFSWNNRLIYQKKMIEFFSHEIDILELNKKSCSEWIGHFGLLLSACEKAEKEDKLLTKTILGQLKIIFYDKLMYSNFLKEIEMMEHNKEIISVSFLFKIRDELNNIQYILK